MTGTIKRKIFNVDRLLILLVDNKSLLLLLALCAIANVTSQGLFFTSSNLLSVFRQSAVMCLMGCGYTILLSCGNLDLSVGSMLSLLGICYAILNLRIPLPLAILFTVSLGAFCGLLNGFLAIKLKLIPFILTMATAQVYRGIAYLLCDGISIIGFSNEVKFLGQGLVFGNIPVTFFFVIFFMTLTAIIIYRTEFGRHVIATGGNSEAARVSGVNTERIKILTFMIMGIFNAISAVVLVGRITVAMPNAGDGMEMNAIASVVIGGTVLGGGKANVIGGFFGSLTLGVINNLLNLAGVSAFWQWVTRGFIIIFAILTDSLTEAFFKHRRTLN